MANPVDPVPSHHTFQERQPAAVPELPNDRPHHPPEQSHAEDHTELVLFVIRFVFSAQMPMPPTSEENHRWRTGRFQSRKEHHRAELQPMNPQWELSPAPARPLPCHYRLQDGLRQGLVCSFMGSHEEVQHQRQLYPRDETSMSRP